MAELACNHLTKEYDGGIVAVSDFSLKVADKEFIVLVGPSGCGKSTVLRLIAGLEEITAGELFINGRAVNHTAPQERNVAMVFQNYALYPHLNVYDNLAFALKIRKVPAVTRRRRLESVAELLGITNLLQRLPQSLSGGQKQRVALGRALVCDADVYLFDEPLANLDAKLRAQMRRELIRLQQQLQATFIYVTHDQTEALTMGHRIAVIRDGIMQQVGTPQELYYRPCNTFVAGFIGSPPMSLLVGELQLEADDFYLCLGEGEQPYRGRLPRHKVTDSWRDHVNKRLVIGIRPETVSIADCATVSSGSDRINCRVEMVEVTGADSYVHLTLGSDSLVARTPALLAPPLGTCVSVRLDLEHVHCFDPVTGKALI